MVGRGDEHGVDILAHLVEHLAVVPVALGVRVAVESILGIFPVDVAQGHDIFGLHVLEVGGAHAAASDGGDIEFVARGGMTRGLAEHGARNDGQSGQTYRAFTQEVPAGYFFRHDVMFWLGFYLTNFDTLRYSALLRAQSMGGSELASIST